jgi:hypothetical protein
MSTDYAEKEREFLATLEADTGRSLAAWMDAISAQNLPGKNEVIDWLRQQGFMFSKASWLERIHDNGGKPIYGAIVAAEPVENPPHSDGLPTPPATPLVADPPHRPAHSVVPKPPPGAADDPILEDLLIKAKALRPLAKHLLREISKTVPAAAFSAAASHVSIGAPREFAVLTISPRELKLGLALAGETSAAPLQPAKFAPPALRISPAITHMVVLTDARQINGPLLAVIARTAASASE